MRLEDDYGNIVVTSADSLIVLLHLTHSLDYRTRESALAALAGTIVVSL
jgi:hypothetical protein